MLRQWMSFDIEMKQVGVVQGSSRSDGWNWEVDLYLYSSDLDWVHSLAKAWACNVICQCQNKIHTASYTVRMQEGSIYLIWWQLLAGTITFGLYVQFLENFIRIWGVKNNDKLLMSFMMHISYEVKIRKHAICSFQIVLNKFYMIRKSFIFCIHTVIYIYTSMTWITVQYMYLKNGTNKKLSILFKY